MDFNTLTKADDAKALVPKLNETTQKALKYLSGDYWQDGTAWSGTRVPKDAQNYAEAVQEQADTFTPEPLIEECVSRIVDALMAQEPAWEFALVRDIPEEEDPTPEEETLLSETNSALGAWWDNRKAHEVATTFAGYLVGAGRASMRFWVPPGLLKDGKADANGNRSKVLDTKDWKAALNAIYLETPALESTHVALDRDTMRSASVFVYTVKDGDKDVERVEVSFLQQDKQTKDVLQTVVRILQGEQIVGEAIQQTGGVLYVDEALMPKLVSPTGTTQEGQGLVSDAVQRNQNANNVLNTMLLYNGNLAGARERSYINLKRPEVEVLDPTPENPHNTKWVPDDVVIGPSAANFFSGVTYKDKDGVDHIATGQIVITNPVDPTPLVVGNREFRRSIYRHFKQGYVEMSGDAAASAIARVTSMVEFVQMLRKIRPGIEGVLRSRLLGVAYLSAYLANDTKRLAALPQLRVSVTVRITPPPLSPDEKRVVVELFKANLIDREIALIFLQVEDIDSVIQKLDADPVVQLRLMKDRADVVYTLSQAGVGVEAAALVAGFSEDEAKQLGKSDFAPEPAAA